MSLHQLSGIEIGVPNPEVLDDFYQEIGLSGKGGRWGTPDRPDQIRVTEAPYRQLRSMRVSCESEADLAAAGRRLEDLGVEYEIGGGQLRATDPINRHEVILEPAPVADNPEQPVRAQNRPGQRPRVGTRAEVIVEERPRPPRRLGHVVIGSPDPVHAPAFYQALGFRVSDVVAGMATFMRCSPDHHNLLIAPGQVPYLNHYALEHDDLDAVARAATLYLRKHGPDHQISGPGRHQVGGNLFWYMRDPAGNFFEFFADMDRILDDQAWEIRTDWDLSDSWSAWGDKDQPEVFFVPDDLDELVAGWTATQS
jgi:hypothetical protein